MDTSTYCCQTGCALPRPPSLRACETCFAPVKWGSLPNGEQQNKYQLFHQIRQRATESKYTDEHMYVLELALEAENQDKMGREGKGWGEMLKMLFSTDRGSHGMSEPQHHPTEKMQPGEGERPAQRHTAMRHFLRLEPLSLQRILVILITILANKWSVALGCLDLTSLW